MMASADQFFWKNDEKYGNPFPGRPAEPFRKNGWKRGNKGYARRESEAGGKEYPGAGKGKQLSIA